MGSRQRPLLEVKCSGTNCERMIVVSGDEKISIDAIKFTCAACDLQTKHTKDSKKATYVRRPVEGQMQLVTQEDDD